MTDVKIECPHCHKSFKLNETLAAPLVEETRRKLEKEFESKEEDLDAKRKAFADEQTAAEKVRKDIEKERAALAMEREKIDEQVAEQVAEQRATIERDAAKKAKQKYDEKIAERDAEKEELEEAMKEKDMKLAEAQQAQKDAIRKQRELDEKIRELDLAAEKKAAELVAPQLEKAKKDAEEAARLRIAEKDKVIEAQKEQLAEAQRKLEQGSQQLQGEIQELDLEKRLADAFRRDTFEEVAKGQRGADMLHRVLSETGQACGSILWESKRTKNWDGKWLDKLKQDQRAAKADLAVIVTQTMPPGLDTFAEIEGVWVTTPALTIALAAALRHALTEAALARRATEGQQDKMAILYQYLTGPQFRQRVEAIKEAFTAMQADLITERTVYERHWAKRQKQIDRVMASTVGMWGELQAIAGASLQQIEGLEMKALETSTQEGEQ
ncbi:MAG: DUF2130 domain-containing protein [Phycisphaeraceae bacterium]|nr:DUF2130 domain-containing protein [Phycisphaeraceae bacterium]MCW5763484.1 DUF2130 domain-containing protein [Phycisphaeraceae bacterium]